MDNRDIIDLWPSVPTLARDLNIQATRAWKWYGRKSIPADWWLRVVKAGRNRGLPVSLEALAQAAEKRSAA